MKNRLVGWWQSWNQFWFEFHRPWGFALARVQVAATMLWLYSVRQFANMESFSEQGLVPRAMALPLMMESYRPPFAWFALWPDSMAPMIHLLFLVALLMVLIGAGARIWGPLAWVLHMGFLQRNYSILFGADVLLGLSLFYLMFTRSEEHLSVRAWWRRRQGSPGLVGGNAVSSAFGRLLMIQLMALYAYTGFEKLKGASWWDGTALWTVLGNPQMVITDMAFLRHFAFLVSAMTFATLIFEIYFPAAMLSPRLRKPWLLAGVLFHLGIAALMDLWTFSLGMLAIYWIFLSDDEIRRVFSFFRVKLSRSSGKGESESGVIRFETSL
ncbi:MAG: HTTM domain-containing protein [Bdellovibrionaceae bacterium]|nr:HTTM domain-containing protein [Pseudobdellovibrionaceae bacterium]